MKRLLLAIAVLLAGSVVPSRADYVVIIANLGQPRELKTPTDPGAQQGGGQMFGNFQQGGGLYGLGGGQNPTPPQDPVIDPDAVPFYVTAVFEIDKVTPALMTRFNGNPMMNVPPQPISVTHKWGKSYLTKNLTYNGVDLRIEIIPTSDKNSLGTQYSVLSEKAFPKGSKEKSNPDAVVALADWCLRHGFLNKFGEAMDKFAQESPSHPAASAYLKVKADLDKPGKTPANAVTQILGNKFKPVTSNHYIAYHNGRSDEPLEVKTRLNRLEDNFRSFYYWFALRGKTLTVPAERLPTIVTFGEDNSDFKHFNSMLTSTPVIADGFVGRREGVSVFSHKRRDYLFDAVDKQTGPIWSQGINRTEVVKAVDVGFPRNFPQDPQTKSGVQTLALLMKIMENDAELASATHDGTRQLLYASNVLHRNVVAPEWIQFGIASFFETPMGSPWVSTGSPSIEYRPLWDDLIKAQRLGKTPSETLKKVVTDSYFHQALLDEDFGSQRRARATSWALGYFLAHRNLDGLQKYLKELSKLPRDLDLDEEMLLQVFAKSFGLLDGTGKIDAKKFDTFAISWYKMIEQEQLELGDVMKKIREITAQLAEDEKKKPANPGGTRPGGPGGDSGGGGNPGGRPGGRPSGGSSGG